MDIYFSQGSNLYIFGIFWLVYKYSDFDIIFF